MTSGFLEKLLARLDRVSPEDVHGYLLRLVKEKGFFERVFEALEEGVIICDATGQITYINRAACRFFGADPNGTAGRKVGEVVRGLDWARLTAGKRAAVSRDLEVFYPENRYLNFYLAPIDDGESTQQDAPHLGYVMLLRDITQTRKVTAEMIEGERLNALTLLAAGVAHEIGNPLNSLNIHLQLLERKLRKADRELYEQIKPQVEVTRGEVQRLHFIIEQFLGAIRPTRPNFELTDLNKVVEEAVSFLAPELKDRRMRTRLQLDSGLPLLRVDANQMKQAFYNLIKNAFQATGTGGKLLIRTELSEYEVRISFKDNGKGMLPETLGQIFEPYFTTKKYGTGLGMLIVRRIVRDHAGEFSLQSEEGVGTTATISLPRGSKTVRFLGSGETDPAEPKSEEVIDV